MTLSKLGLPSLRTGIVIAREETIRIVSKMTSVFSLAPGGMGPALALDMVKSGEITRISREVVRPFYEAKAKRAVAQLQHENWKDLPFAIHKPEGALFPLAMVRRLAHHHKGTLRAPQAKGRARGIRTLFLSRARRTGPQMHPGDLRTRRRGAIPHRKRNPGNPFPILALLAIREYLFQLLGFGKGLGVIIMRLLLPSMRMMGTCRELDQFAIARPLRPDSP